MSNNSKIILPKKDSNGNYYISYSQINKWKRSKREYIRNYFFGENTSSVGLQKYGDFGTLIGEALENNDFTKFSKEEQKFMNSVPRYDDFERKISLDMNGYYVTGYIDTNSTDLNKIADYKTGDINKKKSDYTSKDYIQLDIYAAAIQQETGVLPKDIKVILIGRKGNAFKGEDLILSKEFITIDRKVTMEDIDKVKQEIDKTAKEISDMYKVFLKLT